MKRMIKKTASAVGITVLLLSTLSALPATANQPVDVVAKSVIPKSSRDMFKAEVVDIPPAKGPSVSEMATANKIADAQIKRDAVRIKASTNAPKAAESLDTTAKNATLPIAAAASSGPCATGLSSAFKAVNRTTTCRLSAHEVKIYKYTAGKTQYYGSAFYTLRTTMTTNMSTNLVRVQNDIQMTRHTPNNSITKIGGISFDPQPTSSYTRMSASSTPNGNNGGSVWTGYASFARKAISSGAQSTTKVFTNKVTFANPVYWASSTSAHWDTANVQCDRQVRSNIGCVVPSFIPTITIDKANNPEMNRHLKAAIGSGLPRTLTRTTNEKVNAANRNKACPRSLKRPSGKSCDEYPFASTIEGASRYSGATRRTFSWCSVPGKSGTGARGWSTCMVNDRQNSREGSRLVGFYSSNRIANNNRFHVRTT